MSLLPIIRPVPASHSPAAFAFDGINDVLARTWSSTASNAVRRTWTLSLWCKTLNNGDVLWQARHPSEDEWLIAAAGFNFPILVEQFNALVEVSTSDVPADDVWSHWVYRFDTANGTLANRVRIYLNGSLIPADLAEICTQNILTVAFVAGNSMELMAALDFAPQFFCEGKLAFVDMVAGQSLAPTAFAFNDGGTWTRQPYGGSHGSFGWSLDGTDGFNDVSGNNNHFTQSGGVTLDTNDLPPFTL